MKKGVFFTRVSSLGAHWYFTIMYPLTWKRILGRELFEISVCLLLHFCVCFSQWKPWRSFYPSRSYYVSWTGVVCFLKMGGSRSSPTPIPRKRLARGSGSSCPAQNLKYQQLMRKRSKLQKRKEKKHRVIFNAFCVVFLLREILFFCFLRISFTGVRLQRGVPQMRRR